MNIHTHAANHSTTVVFKQCILVGSRLMTMRYTYSTGGIFTITFRYVVRIMCNQ